MKNCGHRFHVLVASQDFVDGVLVHAILPKNNPPTALHERVLSLIQVLQHDSWQKQEHVRNIKPFKPSVLLRSKDQRAAFVH